jgi:hypothetical protein
VCHRWFMPILIHFDETIQNIKGKYSLMLSCQWQKQWMQSEITFYQLKGHQCVTVTSHWHAQKMQHFSAKSELIVFVSSFSIYTLLISLNKANTGCERQPISFLIYDKSCIGSKSAVTWPQWHMCDIKVQ